ncbi:MAG: hypothetical protein IIB60_01260, partial [Planctomycetes bacterium]|nr:hypothetical protein [Planctomycetota bacterium]
MNRSSTSTRLKRLVLLLRATAFEQCSSYDHHGTARHCSRAVARRERPWFLLIALALVSGCAVPPGAGDGGDHGASASPLPGVDPERAYLALSEIEPPVEPPRTSATQGEP